MTSDVPEWEENPYVEEGLDPEETLPDIVVVDDEPEVDISELYAETEASEPGEFEGTEGVPA